MKLFRSIGVLAFMVFGAFFMSVSNLQAQTPVNYNFSQPLYSNTSTMVVQVTKTTTVYVPYTYLMNGVTYTMYVPTQVTTVVATQSMSPDSGTTIGSGAGSYTIYKYTTDAPVPLTPGVTYQYEYLVTPPGGGTFYIGPWNFTP